MQAVSQSDFARSVVTAIPLQRTLCNGQPAAGSNLDSEPAFGITGVGNIRKGSLDGRIREVRSTARSCTRAIRGRYSY